MQSYSIEELKDLNINEQKLKIVKTQTDYCVNQ